MKANHTLWIAAALLGAMTACSSSTDTEDTTKKENEEVIDATAVTDSAAASRKDDAEFVAAAASGGMMEVEAAKLALTKATSPRVKEFAKMLVDDHTKANEELKALADQKSIMLPPALMDKHQKAMDELREKSGKEFDKKYMDLMVSDHKKDIDEFKNASEDCKDADIKAFAAKTVPTLVHHLEKAEQIEKETDKM